MKKLLSALALVLVSVLGSVPAQAAEPVIIAVFDVDDQTGHFDGKARGQLTDYLSGQVAATGRYRVIPRSQLRSRLSAARKESYKACYDAKCQIEIGRELAAQKSLATKIVQIGSRCALIATLFDLRTATSEKAATEKADCSQDALVTAMEKVVALLTAAQPATGPSAVASGTSAGRAPPSSARGPVGPATATTGPAPRSALTPTPTPTRLFEPQAPADRPRTASDGGWWQRNWVWVVVGAGAAALALGIAVSVGAGGGSSSTTATGGTAPTAPNALQPPDGFGGMGYSF